MSSIVGTWTSQTKITPAGSEPWYGKETMYFSSNGTGTIKRKALLFRTIRTRWVQPMGSPYIEVYAQTGEPLFRISLSPDGDTLVAGWTSIDPDMYQTIFVR